MIHESGGPKSTCQEPGGSTYDCITLISKYTCQKSNRKEPACSKYDRLMFVLKKIWHVKTKNKITSPSIINTYEIDITQKCNGLHQKYVDITKIYRHQNETGGKYLDIKT